MTYVILNILKTIVLGIVEGITEWLPISSTGHLIIFEQFLNLNVYENLEANAAFLEMFRVVIQLGAILAVILLYFHKLNPFSSRKTEIQRKNTFSLWAKVIVACIPSAVIGLMFDELMDEYLYRPLVVAITLIIYGVAFIVVEKRNRSRRPAVTSLSDLSYKTALMIGAFQILSLIPGTSRSGATILGGILLCCARPVAAEFSFFLAIPTMFGASFLKLVKYFAQGHSLTGGGFVILLVGMLISFVVSVVAIKFLMNYIKKKDFTVFGYYRIILGILVLLCAACSIIPW